MKYAILFIFPVSGICLVTVDKYIISVPQWLIYPFHTDVLFYAQGTFLFHLVGIAIVYFILSVIVFIGCTVVINLFKK